MNSDKEPIILPDKDDTKVKRPQKNGCKLTVLISVLVFVCAAAAAVGISLYFVLIRDKDTSSSNETKLVGPTCPDQCILSLVESIPENLTYPKNSPSHPSTYDALMQLMVSAKETIEIASYYWTLNGSDISYHDQSSWQGESILKTLAESGHNRNIKVKIAQNMPKQGDKTADIDYLKQYGKAEVRSLNFTRLLGAGILHTKMWLIDRKHLYVGSSNLDWRSFTQVKELGAVLYNCSCMAQDMGKLFDAYWYLGKPGVTIPDKWDPSFSTAVNRNTSMQILYNNTKATSYLSSSPPPFCATGRTIDIDAIVNVIDSAEEFVYVAVMDYFPTTQYVRPRKFWPVIDDAFRRAAFDRKVNVSLLISYWSSTWDDMPTFLKSLAELRTKWVNINIKMFEVPAFTESQKKIPFSRVNHNKYMVTDKTAYIGTSNWSGDYFIDTGGIGLIVNQKRAVPPNHGNGQVRQQVEDIFLRDWNSPYATDIWHFNFTNRHDHEEF